MSTAAKTMFQRVCVIGIGLIGSSLARAIAKQKLAEEIVGCDLSVAVCREALDLGVVDAASSNVAEMAAGADLIILSAPVGATTSILETLAGNTDPQALLMDVGSVKGSVVSAVQVAAKDLLVVPAHPVAGTENSGPSAGFAELFESRWCILTPLERRDETYLAAVDKIEALWKAIGSDVVRMDAEHHDLALAVTSHLPHLIAYTLVGAADDVENVNEAEVVKYSAGGFRDFTRIAASDPVMWRDVFLHNKDAGLEVLGRFSEELAVMQRAIRWGDAETLEKAFTRSRGLRKAIIEAGQDSATPNFGRDENTE